MPRAEQEGKRRRVPRDARRRRGAAARGGLDPQKIGEGLDSIDRMEAIFAAAAPYWHPSQAEIGCYQDDLEAGGRFLHPSLRIKVKVHLGTGCEECRKIVRLRSALTGLLDDQLGRIRDSVQRLRAAGREVPPLVRGDRFDSVDRLFAAAARTPSIEEWPEHREEAIALIVDYLVGDLDAERREGVELHAESCAECRELLAMGRREHAGFAKFFAHPDPVRAREGLKKVLTLGLIRSGGQVD